MPKLFAWTYRSELMVKLTVRLGAPVVVRRRFHIIATSALVFLIAQNTRVKSTVNDTRQVREAYGGLWTRRNGECSCA